MNQEKQSELDDDSGDYDISRLLDYRGPGFRQQESPENNVILADYRNSDRNEQHISTLLSSKGIPFYIERPQVGLPGTQILMFVSVPRVRQQQTLAVLNAAVKAGFVEIVKGAEGLSSHY